METTARGRSGVVEEMLRTVKAEAVAATLYWCVCSDDGRSNLCWRSCAAQMGSAWHGGCAGG